MLINLGVQLPVKLHVGRTHGILTGHLNFLILYPLLLLNSEVFL
uniref:Uncharacterized protein n=1 Tax=Arundo donax TaxID=35708 RepID=A0A0A9GBE5_ARUDO